MGHFVYEYEKGVDMAEMLLAEKPNDWHSVTARHLGISRGDCKSINYGLIYGAQASKVAKMLNVSIEEGTDIYNGAWDAMPALKAKKSDVEYEWERNNKKFIRTIDGRKIFVRSKHSLLNFLFQSAGVVCAKYANVFMNEILEKQGLINNPFKGKPDVCNMIEYHDEADFACRTDLFEYEFFKSKEEAKEFQDSWSGAQLSEIGHIDDIYFIAKPNVVSLAMNEAVNKVNEKFNLKVPLATNWQVGRNWAQCH